MGLSYKIESLDEIDTTLESFYEKTDDGYVLSIEGLPKNEEDPVKLKETLVKVRDERKREEKEKKLFEQQLRELKSKYADIDPEEYTTLKTMQAEIAKQEEERLLKEAEAKKDWEALQKQLQDKYNAEIDDLSKKMQNEVESRESKISNMQKALYQHIAETTAVKAIADAKGKISVLKPHIMPFIQIAEEQSDTGISSYIPRVVDNQGNVRVNKETGEPMTIDDFINELKSNPDFQGDGIFERPKKMGGSDSAGNISNSVSKDNPWSKEYFNLTQQGMIIRTNPVLAAKLKAEAGL